MSKKTLFALLATTMLVTITLSGCLGNGESEGWTQDDLVVPNYQVEHHPDPLLPTPLSDLTYPYSYSLVWTMTEVYESYGGMLNISMENTGSSIIFVYRFGVKWVNNTIFSERPTEVYVEPGEKEDLGLLFFRAPSDDSGAYEIHIWLCASNAGVNKWHDYGEVVGATRTSPIKPRLVEETNYSVSKNPSDYFDKVNEKVDYDAVEFVASQIRAGCSLNQSINQIVGAFNWVRDNIEYIADEGGDYWQSAEETLLKGMGDCEDQAILLSSIFGALGLNGRVNIIERHAFASVFVSETLFRTSSINEVIESLYWTELPICYLQDEMGYWLVTDTTGFFYTGGMPAESMPVEGSNIDAWTFESTDYLTVVDATGQTSGLDLWPF